MESSGWSWYVPKAVTQEVTHPTLLPSIQLASKRRFYLQSWFGLSALCGLNLISGLNWLWFSAIAAQATEEFDISLQEINWLGTCVNVAYLPMSILVPLSLNRWGMRASCALGSLLLIIASWVRYAGSVEILPSTWRYKLLLMGQILAGCGQPWFQILGPTYSEVWFNGHATATMVLSVASPVGAALSQLIAPTFMTLLILAIITSITAPAVLLVCPAPRTLASQNGYGSPAPVLQALRALICRSRPGEIVMSPRECTDMAITTLIFGVIVSAFSAILILVNQILTPHGYSPREASTMSGVLVLAGFIGAVITSPIVDRYLSGYLPFVAKVFAPMAAIAYIMLIWDTQANNHLGLYVIIVVIGVASFSSLPLLLKIGSKLSGGTETSSAILWFMGNLLSAIVVLSMDALRDKSPTADPSSNMQRSLIFLACFVASALLPVFALRNHLKNHDHESTRLDSDRKGIDLTWIHTRTPT